MVKNNTKRQASKGSRFGALTVIRDDLPKHVEPSGHARYQVRVLCDCGTQYDLCALNLTRGTSTQCRSCGHNARRRYRIGSKFDKLTILRFVLRDGRQKAVCKCDCGKTVEIRNNLLGYNKTNNCGCAPRGKWRGVGRVSMTHFSRIKYYAAKRGIPFKVSHSYVAELFEKQQGVCAITTQPLSFGKDRNAAYTASLDRIDNTKGYVAGNVWWVHGEVNVMKMDLPLSRFFDLCKLVAVYAEKASV